MEQSDGTEAAEILGETASRDWQEAEGADIDPELPQNLRDLLRRLAVGGLSPDVEPVRYWPDLEHYGDFFGLELDDVRRTSPSYSSVRLKVLQALGRCRTLKEFHCWIVQRWQLTVTEWKALLVPMQASVDLEEIEICPFRTAEEEDLLGPYLAGLISQSQKLRVLILDAVLEFEYTAKFAAVIASAVRARARAHYPSLERLQFSPYSPEEGVFASIAEMISSAPKLELLQFGNVRRALRGHEKEALSGALRGLASLRLLYLSGSSQEMMDVVVDAYSGTSSDPVLEKLQLHDEVIRGGRHPGLALVIRGNIRTIHIDPFGDTSGDMPHLDGWQEIGRSLLNHPTLVKFHLHLDIEDRLDLRTVEYALAGLWNSSQQSPLLHIQLSERSSLDEDLLFLQKALDYPCVKGLCLKRLDVGTEDFRSFVDKLASNPSLDELQLHECCDESGKGWTYLFSHLRNSNSTSITVLDLEGSEDLDDENLKDVIDLLQVNYTLRSIGVGGTAWDKDGKRALIDAALQRNTKQEGYFSVLREAKLSFDGAKAGRIFLCGNPRAGKTRLKVTMMETKQKKSKSGSVRWIPCKKMIGKFIPKFHGTEGIEVELLSEDQSATISIWDLAGQEIFRALHHLLFPRISQACIFVFVFNPFEGEGKKRRLKSNLDKVFEQELRSWLRFVVSNTQITGSFLPQMLVIITHKDKLQMNQKDRIRDLERIVKRLQEKYKDVVNLCHVGDGECLIYQVNAKDKENVQPIIDLVVSSMKKVLEGKSPHVPRACSELVPHLLGGQKKDQLSPLWSCEEFYRFCSKQVFVLKVFTLIEKRGRSVLHAVASYLHDAGIICMTPSAMEESEDLHTNFKKMVVVDLNWLTQNFLGKIISYGHGFDVHSRQASAFHPEDHNASIDGFLPREKLHELIEAIIEQNGQALNVKRDLVEELLFELDLCYNIDFEGGQKMCFMPILFATNDGMSERMASNRPQWSMELVEGSGHFGF